MSLFTRCTGQFPDDSGIVRIALHDIRSHLTNISAGIYPPIDAMIEMNLDADEQTDFMTIVGKIAASTVDKLQIADRIFAHMLFASRGKVVGGIDFTNEANFWERLTTETGVV